MLSKFIIFSTILATFFSCDCDKDEEMLMPPETSTGAETFGCYVSSEDNERTTMFVHPKRKKVGQFGLPSLEVMYHSGTEEAEKSLIIYSYDFDGRYIYMVDSLLLGTGKTYKLSTATFGDGINKMFRLTEDLTGEIHYTRLDLENRIVSGRFSFMARQDNSDSTVVVSEGRFDLKMYYIDGYHNLEEMIESNSGTTVTIQ